MPSALKIPELNAAREKIEYIPGIPEKRKTRRLLNPGGAGKNSEEQDDFCSPVMQFTNPFSQS
jgi:hypothetical protein